MEQLVALNQIVGQTAVGQFDKFLPGRVLVHLAREIALEQCAEIFQQLRAHRSPSRYVAQPTKNEALTIF